MYTIDPLDEKAVAAVGDLERHDVLTRLQRTFPGSPVELTFRFGLRGDRIAALEIAP